MSGESNDIAEQGEHGQFELTNLDPRSDNALDEDKQGEQRFRLMGYHLLYIAVALPMITWKLVSSFHKLLVISPKAEAFLWPLLGFIAHFFVVFACEYPEVCPRFLQVDLTAYILGVVRRSSDDAGSELPLPTRGSVVRNDALEEENQNTRPPFGVELTGYRLLNIVIILAFGIPKAVLSYRGQSITPTTLDLIAGTSLAIILYYLGLLQDKRPDICPNVFQADLAPPILKFICRSEVYLFVLSLISLRPVVELLRFVTNVRSSSELDAQAPHSPIILRTTLVVVIVGLILGTFTTVQQFTKVVHLRAFHRFLANDILSTILMLVGIASRCYVQIHLSGVSAQDIHPTTKELADNVVLLACLLSPILSRARESPTDSLALQPAKGWLVVCLLITWAIFEIIRYQHRPLCICGAVIFFLHRFLSTLPISWHFSITSVRKAPRAVYNIVRRAGRKVWGYCVRVVHRG